MLHKWLEKTIGFYVEAGCNDGVTQSNTLWLEHLGWSGLLIEPNRRKLDMCKSNRSPTNIFEHCALVSKDFSHKFVEGNFDESDKAASLTAQINIILPEFDKHQTEGVREKENREMIAVPAKTLQSILDEYSIKCIDYMSLDVEGFEYQAMDGLDFVKNPPRVIQVETSTYDYRVNKMIAYLDNKGYEYLGPPNADAQNDRLFKLR